MSFCVCDVCKLTIFWWARTWWRITAQVIARVGVLMHRREGITERTARTRKAGVLTTLRPKVLVAAAYRTIAAIDRRRRKKISKKSLERHLRG